MLKIIVNDGDEKTKVGMKGDTISILKEATIAIEAVWQTLKDHKDVAADMFAELFYTMADDRAFFKSESDDEDTEEDCEDCHTDDDKETPEEILRAGLIKHGASDTTADKITAVAQVLVDLLHDAADEAVKK